MELRFGRGCLAGLRTCFALLVLARPALGQATKPVAEPQIVEGPQGSVFETPVGPGRLALLSLALTESAQLNPRGVGNVKGRTRHTERTLSLSWELNCSPDWRRRLHRVEDFLGRDDQGTVYRWEGRWALANSYSALVPKETDPVRIWMPFPGLDLRARRLVSLQGGLLFYERATPLKLDFPLVHQGPAETRTAEARAITLTNVQVSGTLVGFTLKYRGLGRKPGAWRDEVEKLQIRIVDANGKTTSPLQFIAQYREAEVEISRLHSDSLVPPLTLRVEGFLLSEKLVRIPVAVRNLEFPRPDDPRAARDPRQHGIQEPGRQNGLSLQVTRGGQPSGAGILSLQFEPVALPNGLTFRLGCLDIVPDPQGRIRIRGLRPGGYRVTCEWRSGIDLGAAPVIASPHDITIPEDGEITLPSLDLKALEQK